MGLINLKSYPVLYPRYPGYPVFFVFGLLYHSLSCYATHPIQKIETPLAPKPYGAYSQGVSLDLEGAKKLVFVSGQVPFNPKTGQMVENDIRAATNQSLDNIEAILKAAGSDWKYVVRLDVFLKDFDRDWAGMNEECSKRLGNGILPARQSAGAQIGQEPLVEISCIAIVPKK